LAKRSDRIDWKEVRRFAVAGARVRLQELRDEMSKILVAFPQLGMEAGVAAVPPKGGIEGTARRPRRRMSAAARKRISEAQKARWAELKGVRAKHA
jgi:hypothetical protein